MDNVLGSGDNSWWEGLACPPLDEYAFSFDVASYKLDDILDNPGNEDSTAPNEVDVIDSKTIHRYGNYGRGKQLKLNFNVEKFKAFLEQETEPKGKKRRIMDCYNSQPLQQKERPRLAVVDSKKKADFYARLEAPRHGSHESTCKPMQPKYMASLNNANQLGVVDKKRKADTDLGLEASRRKLKEASDSACQPIRREDLMRLDYSKRLAVTDNKMDTDYNLRYEATRRMLHGSYGRVHEAKQQRKIQVIDFETKC